MHNVKLLRLEVLCEKYFLIHLAGKINNSCFSFVRSQKLIICFPVFWSQGNKVSSDLHSIYHVAHCTPPLWGPKLEFVVPILVIAASSGLMWSFNPAGFFHERNKTVVCRSDWLQSTGYDRGKWIIVIPSPVNKPQQKPQQQGISGGNLCNGCFAPSNSNDSMMTLW